MKTIPPFPYFSVQFDKAGRVFDAAEVQALEERLKPGGSTDLLVLAHGWNNDSAEAEALYEKFLTNAASALASDVPKGLSQRRFAVLGVLWPSKKFADEDLIPSGAAGVQGTVETRELVRKLGSLEDTFDTPDAPAVIGRLKKLVPKLEDSETACRKFAEEMRRLVTGTGTDPEDGSDSFRLMDAGDLFERMSMPISFASEAPPTSEGGAGGFGVGSPAGEGAAAGLGGWISGPLSGARNLLNYTTYYQMKERAGKVGASGVNPVLRTIQRIRPDLRVHLVGHSFGGRLVTAAVAAGGIRVATMSLLQAAFSQLGFSPDWNGQGVAGAFRGVIDRKSVVGPIVVTHSSHDTAVGRAYPMASLLAGQTAAGLGDKNSPYGGIGRNGAQRTPEAVDLEMGPVGFVYRFRDGGIHNLKADGFVSDHSDVTNPAVVHAVLSAVASVGARASGAGSGTAMDPGIGDDPLEARERIQRILSKTVVALPLLEKVNRELLAPSTPPASYEVIVDSHLEYRWGRKAAREWIRDVLSILLKDDPAASARLKTRTNSEQTQYVFVALTATLLRDLVELDTWSDDQLLERGFPAKTRVDNPQVVAAASTAAATDSPSLLPAFVPKAIYQIWEDFAIHPLIYGSVSTVKANAARAAFEAAGKDIVWAVVDSGIDAGHVHFEKHGNLRGGVEAWHRDFTGSTGPSPALVDEFGHGTHVAGIIAGEVPRSSDPNTPPDAANPGIIAYQRALKANDGEVGREVELHTIRLPSISGMAPLTRLVSLRVLDGSGRGNVSNIIAALAHIQEINAHGRRIRIHGVNLSVGYPFDPEWFACGQSQLCVEVDRLVRSGVIVVAAAGNTGYGTLSSDALGARKAGMALTINDPGNAQLAITVGSTHRTMPHVYGVSYFSSKGPTGDGRRKPDLLAPGEKVLSCAAGKIRDDLKARLDPGATEPNYAEYTGTSMAAPHVSGCMAGFLSVKREFIGQPEQVKTIFLKTATDLGREPSFQGAGLVDLMRAIQFV
ncbi:MAG: S8 family serine peptidase [Limisphaerales bacterium]